MPETKVQRGASAPKASATRKRPPAARKRPVESNGRARVVVDRTTELSDEVLKSVESGQLAAIDAVHKFVDTVDEKLPSLGDEHPSTRQGSWTPPWRWPTDWSTRSTTSFATSCRAPVKR